MIQLGLLVKLLLSITEFNNQIGEIMNTQIILRHFKHSTRVEGLQASDIWVVWADITNWPEWNKGLAKCSIDGTFIVGQTFSLLPKGVPPETSPYITTLTLVEENIAFNDTTPVPWGTVNGAHKISVIGDYIELSHEVTAEVNADKIEFFDSVMAEKWKTSLPDALTNVVIIAKKMANIDSDI